MGLYHALTLNAVMILDVIGRQIAICPYTGCDNDLQRLVGDDGNRPAIQKRTYNKHPPVIQPTGGYYYIP